MAAAAEILDVSKPLSVVASVQTPRYAIRLTLILLVFLIVVIPALLLAPWRQTVYGSGQVIAFNPTQRPQFVTTAVEGVIVKWHVYEGQKVKKGQRLVQLRDNDPDILVRLSREKTSLEEQRRQAGLRIDDANNRIRNFEDSQRVTRTAFDARISAAEAEVRAAERGKDVVEARLVAARLQRDRVAELEKTQAMTKRDLDQAVQEFDQATKELARAGEAITAAAKRVEQAVAEKKNADDVAGAGINGAKGDLRVAAAAEQAVLAQTEIFSTRFARQDNLDVFAPTNGTVFRLLANGEGNQFVRAQERLARIVPDVPDLQTFPIMDEAKTPGMEAAAGVAGAAAYRTLTDPDVPAIVTELNIDGNDLPLIKRGDRVLLQFEGWAAVQFAAYPDAATGTFEGKVYLVDPTADDRGLFRVLVEPAATDPTGRQADPWPNQEILRQGVRAQGWFLLEEVSIGYELWRLLNGFPVARPLDDKSKASSMLGPVKSNKGK